MMVKKKALFITRNGLLEPLGQSQILAYLLPLTDQYTFHIISFEEVDDFDGPAYRALSESCLARGVHLVSLRYGASGRRLSVLTGFVDLYRTARRVCRQEGIEVIHARSYYPAFVTLSLYRSFGIPLIFDMRALWPEELAASGRIKPRSVVFRTVKWLERRCLRKAAAIVSLTRAAVDHLVKENPALELADKFSVIPTCTDINRFELSDGVVGNTEDILLSCFGTLISGWFLFDYLRLSVDYLLTNYDRVNIEILTRDDQTEVMARLDPERKWAGRIIIFSATPQEMPGRMQRHAGTMFFFRSDISKLGSFPTRMAEALSAGLPLLANPYVRDVADIINDNEVGVVMRDLDPATIARGCDAFMQLVCTPGIAGRCRSVAEEQLSLDSGIQRYRRVYGEVLSKRPEVSTVAAKLSI